ncbi:MAG: hypothetical protein LBP32_02100 [Spirochaetaceae bacterium]|jgi:hypothetical protein|nr:hypothetical protein [Spirochaetaceae bacterium]
MELGKKIWVFADGDLPPHGTEEPLGHEALMLVNYNEAAAHIELEFLFDNRDPVSGIHLEAPAKRVSCYRMDYPLGEEGFEIPFGQYAVILKSDVPVVCLYGRLDRRPNMAYYPIAGYSV